MWLRPEAQESLHWLWCLNPNLRPSQPATKRWACQAPKAAEKNISKTSLVQAWALTFSPLQPYRMRKEQRSHSQSMRTSTTGIPPPRPVNVFRTCTVRFAFPSLGRSNSKGGKRGRELAQIPFLRLRALLWNISEMIHLSAWHSGCHQGNS